MKLLTRLLVILLAAAHAARAQQLDTASALGGLRDARAACALDAGHLWERSLCGPIALVDPATRLVIATDSAGNRHRLPLGDAWVTSLPAGQFVANTSFDWAGRRWAMIMVPLPADRFDRVTLLMHEVFHREQDSLGLAGQDPPNNQLDERDGRTWFRLELRALTAALEALPASREAAREHVVSALTFRARRRLIYPLADSLESALEMQEGLAEYTGERLAMNATGEGPSRVARHLREFEKQASYVRSFGYATGPALGVLLDEFAPGWRAEVRATRDPARLLASGLRFVSPKDLAKQSDRRAARYGVEALAQEESQRDSVRRPKMLEYRRRFVEGPVLTLTQDFLGRSFNPNELVGFDVRNTVYPTGTLNSSWGSLEVTAKGALVANDYRTLIVGAGGLAPEAGARVVSGDGWKLTLASGYILAADAKRPGSWVVRKP
ncbi:MAG: hypothetical protein JWO05_1073 [Gemmatimonadetes bacterium]|nr:hypothetical protein [Gemmatimonadota bacterium]